MNKQELIENYTKLLPVNNSINLVEAERRAGEFLYALAHITDLKHSHSNDKIKLLSYQTAVYAQELSKGTAKTMTENKVTAEASKEYTEAREDLEVIENDISYLKAYYDIFMAAHVFYRQMAKGDNL